MTVIAAYYDGHRTVMAADSASWRDGLKMTSPGKVMRLGPALVGVSGFRCHFDFLRQFEQERSSRDGYPSSGELLVVRIADEWRTWCKGRGDGKVDEAGTFGVMGSCMLVGTGQGLWLIDGGFYANRVMEPYAAIGSGQHVAYGALWALQSASYVHDVGPPHEVVAIAVRAAIAHDDACGGDVEVWRTEEEG